MNATELLKKAIVFKAGHPSVANGYIFWKNEKGEIVDNPPADFDSHYYTVEKRGSKWAVCDGRYCLSKSQSEFIYESLPSNRTDEFKADTRFDSAEKAFEALQEFQVRTYNEALKNERFKVWKCPGE